MSEKASLNGIENILPEYVTDQPTNEDVQREGKSFKEWRKILKTASVEVAAVFLMTSTLLSYLYNQNLMILNICITVFGQSAEVCEQVVNVNETYTELETEVQKVFAEAKIYRSIADNTFPIIFAIIMGPWSDHYGRKLVLIIPFFGFILQNLTYLIFSLYYETVNHHLLNIVPSVIKGVTGGEVAYAMAAYSYICDITTYETRTIRSGLLNAGIILGVPIGFACGGALIKTSISYPSGFAISIVLLVIGLAHVLFGVKNTTSADRRALETAEGVKHNDLEDSLKPNPGFWDVINPKNNLMTVFALPFVKRKDNGRLYFWILLLLFVCSASPFYGEFGLVYLFLRDRLKWDAVAYGAFSTYNSFIGVTGVILSMGILSKWLKLSDPVVGFIAGTSQMAGSFIYAFAMIPWVMYLAPTVDMMNGTMIVVSRSMLSKLVYDNEIGKLFSLLAILDSIIPLVMNPLYTAVYRATLDSFSGSFYLLSAALTIPPQIIFVWFKFFKKSDEIPKKSIPTIIVESDDPKHGIVNLAFSGE